VDGLTQDPIHRAGTFKYELPMHQNGPFFITRMAPCRRLWECGIVGITPSKPIEPVVDHDFAMIVQESAILHSEYDPNSVLEPFNFYHQW